MMLALMRVLTTIRPLADTLVVRRLQDVMDTTWSVAPHGSLEDIGQIIAVGTIVIIALLVGGLFWGIYALTK